MSFGIRVFSDSGVEILNNSDLSVKLIGRYRYTKNTVTSGAGWRSDFERIPCDGYDPSTCIAVITSLVSDQPQTGFEYYTPNYVNIGMGAIGLKNYCNFNEPVPGTSNNRDVWRSPKIDCLIEFLEVLS